MIGRVFWRVCGLAGMRVCVLMGGYTRPSGLAGMRVGA